MRQGTDLHHYHGLPLAHQPLRVAVSGTDQYRPHCPHWHLNRRYWPLRYQPLHQQWPPRWFLLLLGPGPSLREAMALPAPPFPHPHPVPLRSRNCPMLRTLWVLAMELLCPLRPTEPWLSVVPTAQVWWTVSKGPCTPSMPGPLTVPVVPPLVRHIPAFPNAPSTTTAHQNPTASPPATKTSHGNTRSASVVACSHPRPSRTTRVMFGKRSAWARGNASRWVPQRIVRTHGGDTISPTLTSFKS